MDGTGGFWRSMKTAFNNWWTVAGIIAASVTGFNLLRRFADIGLTTVLADLFDMYQHWIHFPVIKLFDLFSWPHPPSWAIDLVLLWILVAGVLTRTWLSMFGEISKYRDDYKVDFQTYLKIFLHTWLLMPVAVLGILHSPSVYRNDQTQVLFNGDKPDKDWSLYCDLRLVLGAQALALLACIAAWVASNVLAEKYLG